MFLRQGLPGKLNFKKVLQRTYSRRTNREPSNHNIPKSRREDHVASPPSTSLPTFQIVVVGTKGVGKSTLILQYVRNVEKSAITEGMYVSWKKRVVIEDKEHMLDLRDTRADELGQFVKPGQEDREIVSAHGFVLVFNLKNKESFLEMNRIRTYIYRARMELKEDRVPMILVATFADCEPSDRQISITEIKDLAMDFECPYHEFASSNQKEAQSIFVDLVRDMYICQLAKATGTRPPVTPVIKEARQSKMFRYSRADAPDIKFSKKDTNAQPQIRAATVERLVQRLTYEKYPDPNLVATFLLTYRSFTTPQHLMNLLITRYCVEFSPDQGISQADWVKNVQTPIRLRVFNVLKTWLMHHYGDFEADPGLPEKCKSFVETQMMDTMRNCAVQLLKALERRSDDGWISSPSHIKAPKPRLPKKVGSSSGITFLDLDPLEVARQLALIDFNLYKQIQPHECMGQPWNKPGSKENAPHVVEMIQRFNQMSGFVMTEILNTDKLKNRAAVLKMMIQIAKKSYKLNNFNGVFTVMSGLESSAVHRLKKTWKSIPKKNQQDYQDLKALCTTRYSFKALREKIHTANPPIIPYLGVYLSDLTFIEDGNSDLIDGGLINFDKRRLLASVIAEIQQYQLQSYAFAEIPPIRDFLLSVKGMDEDEAYGLSLSIEPRKPQSIMSPPSEGPDLMASPVPTKKLAATLSDNLKSISTLPARFNRRSSMSKTPSMSSITVATESPFSPTVPRRERSGSSGKLTGESLLKSQSSDGAVTSHLDFNPKETQLLKKARDSLALNHFSAFLDEISLKLLREEQEAFKSDGDSEISMKSEISGNFDFPGAPHTSPKPTHPNLSELIVTSQTLEVILSGIVSQAPRDAEAIISILRKTTVGDPVFIYQGLLDIGKAQIPEEVTNAVIKFICAHSVREISPQEILKLKSWTQEASQVERELKYLENAEGCQSVEQNQIKMSLSSSLLSIHVHTRQFLIQRKMNSSGSRSCIVFDQDSYLQLENIVEHSKKKSDANFKFLESFMKKMAGELRRIAEEDEDFLHASIVEASADIFETCEAHLTNIYDQMLIVQKRLGKIMELRAMETDVRILELEILAKNLEATFHRELNTARDVIRELDSTEVVAAELIDGIKTDRRLTSVLSPDQIREAGKLFQVFQVEIQVDIPSLS
eukprot:TRINITY_DN1560_c0_g1_i1.p1 TRINITY_DN1560_c0_g1~~TRINITY_DN1560_c0_g1_i1.p1  ORF type:complete len:1166 (+),score=383.87 TRINITY_DN1560_c0_g1_i1:136-3633(+)